MKTRQTLARITLALATVMFPFLHAHSWDWEWTDTWNEAVATCGECGEEYTFYAESSSEAEEIAAEFFCECGSCLADVNEECYQEHHCEFCSNCIEDGEYHDGVYNLLDVRLCYDCADEMIEAGLIPACHYCHELFGEGAEECDCEYSMITPHCTDCADEQCEKCGICMVIAGEETEAVQGDACLDHLICNPCMDDAAADDLIHCRQCVMCDEEVCSECGMCESCAIYEEHCPECGTCFGGEIDWCKDGGEHCIHCCEDNDWICQFCNRCMGATGLDQCSDCELCEECCHELAESEGCEHGYCLASSDYEDHLCPECGQCPQDEECEYCGLCADCQTDYHCEHELCPDGSEWDDHVCPDCGECFDEGELCEYCGLCEDCREHCDHDVCPENDDADGHFICDQCGDCYEGEDRCDVCELCLDCCADNTSSMGCDHDLCIESDEFAEHWCYEDDQCLELCEHEEDCEHENVTTAWNINNSAHWLVCEDCGIAVNKALHTGGEPVTLTSPNAATHTNGTAQVNCSVCDYKMGIIPIPYVEAPADGSPYIITQPTDYTGRTNTGAWREEDGDRYTTFKVKAGGEGLSYQWYCRYGTGSGTKLSDDSYTVGTQTPTLKTLVYGDDCERQDRNIYCIVSNSKGSVTSDAAYFKAEHVFGRYTKKDNETHENHCFGEGCSVVKSVSKHRFSEWTLVRAATSDETGLREQQCMDCNFKNSESIPKVEPDHVHSFDMARYSLTQHWFVCSCGIASTEPRADHSFDQTEVVTPATETAKGENKIICSACGYFKTEKTDKLPHEHVWYTFSEIRIVLPNGHTGPDRTKGSYGPNSHTIKCKGCNERKTEKHTWGMFECRRDAKVQGNDTIPGRIVRACEVCSYDEEKFYPLGSWPIMIGGGTAYKGLKNSAGQIIRWITAAYAKKGDIIQVVYDPMSARTLDGSGFNLPQKFKSWTDGTGYTGETNIPWDNGRSSIDLPRLTFRFNRTTRQYQFTMPDGPATIFAVTEECTHTGSTKQSDRVEATCSSSGHEPHTLCADCDEILVEGARIPALGHDLPSTPIAGTAVVEYCMKYTTKYYGYFPNDATHGFTGDFVCNRCGETVKGKRTPLQHGVYDPWGTRTDYNWPKVENAVDATCTTDGRTGDLYCRFCNMLVERSEKELRHGHDWEAWNVVREATTKVKGMERRICAYDETHVETRITDYSGPDYTLKPDKTKLRFEWVYGQEPPTQVITFKSTGRDSILAITDADEPSYGDVLHVSTDGMKVYLRPNINGSHTPWMRSDEVLDVGINKVLTKEGETWNFTVPEIHFTCDIKNTAEKYTLTVENGLASTLISNGHYLVPSTTRGSKLQIRGGERIQLEPEDEWKKDFLRWEIVKDASGMTQKDWEGRATSKNAWLQMSPNDVTIRAIYKKNEPSMTFSQTEVTATMDALDVTPKLRTSPGNLPVTYRSSDETVAKVDAKTGAVTYLKAGIATITASFSGNDHYSPATASYSLRITQDFIDGVRTISGSPTKSEEMYNTLGQRVGKDYKGVVVKKGKKEIIAVR